MKTLQDEFFDEEEFGTVQLDDLDVDTAWDSSDDPEEWSYIRGRTQSRDVMLYNSGIYKVIKGKSTGSLTDEVVETVSVEEVLERMPKRERENMVVPSPSGEYITVIEVRGRETEDGTITIETKGRTSTIPVEFAKDVLTYDEVVIDLID